MVAVSVNIKLGLFDSEYFAVRNELEDEFLQIRFYTNKIAKELRCRL